MVAGAGGRREQKVTASGHRLLGGGGGSDENVLELVMMAVQLCEHTNNHWILYFKGVNFMIHELYLDPKMEGK